MIKPILLIGGGGHCKSVINSAESAGLKIKGILDLPEFIGHEVLGYKVIGSDEEISKYSSTCDFLVTIGFIKDPNVRIKLHEKIISVGGSLAILIANDASVHRTAKIGDGSVILHHATINSGSKIGLGCIINTNANIEHDVEIGDYTHVSTGAMINGDCKIGKRVFIGSGSVIVNGSHIVDDVIIGAGAVVVENIDQSGLYVGNPVIKVR